MKNKLVVWFGLVFVQLFLLAACSGATPTPQADETKFVGSVVTEEPKPTDIVIVEEPTLESIVTEEPTAESVVTEETESTENMDAEEAETTGLSAGEMAPDFTLPDSNGNEVSLADTLQENEQVVIVFYYEIGCSPCMAQLFEIEKDYARYEEKGAQVIAIAVQSETYAEYTRKTVHAQFPILADGDHAVAEAFGVLEDRGLSTPSVFIINKDRQIVWSEISHIEGSGCGTERVPSQTILENLG